MTTDRTREAQKKYKKKIRRFSLQLNKENEFHAELIDFLDNHVENVNQLLIEAVSRAAEKRKGFRWDKIDEKAYEKTISYEYLKYERGRENIPFIKGGGCPCGSEILDMLDAGCGCCPIESLYCPKCSFFFYNAEWRENPHTGEKGDWFPVFEITDGNGVTKYALRYSFDEKGFHNERSRKNK